MMFLPTLTTYFTLHKMSPHDRPPSTPTDYHLIKADSLRNLVETSVQQPSLLSISQCMPYAGLSSVVSYNLSIRSSLPESAPYWRDFVHLFILLQPLDEIKIVDCAIMQKRTVDYASAVPVPGETLRRSNDHCTLL